MPEELIQLRLQVAEAGLDSEELADRATALVGELSQLDVDDISPVTEGEAPPGSKGLELATIGAMIVTLVRSREKLAEVVATVRDWLGRGGGGNVRLEIDGDVLEVSDVSAAERKKLIDTWVQRHTEP